MFFVVYTILKKQSQFVPGQNGATSYLKGDYDNKPACEADENKANKACPERSRMGQFSVGPQHRSRVQSEKPPAAATG